MDKTKELPDKPGASFDSDDAGFISRQPIYDRSVNLFAYQLLYANDENLTAEVFLNTFLDLGLEAIVGDSPAFINVTRKFLLDGYCSTPPKGKVVLGIPWDIQPDESVIKAIASLSGLGYSISIDYLDDVELQHPLLKLANFVNVNFETFTNEEAAGHLQRLRQFNAKLVARNVNTQEDFERAKSLGFEYFRGVCYIRPKTAKAQRVPINRLSTMQLILKLQEPELSSSELEKIIGQDLAISFKLLHYVNSAALSLPRSIESIRHAIQMVGTQRIRVWASLLLLGKLDDKPAELMVTALIRATMAERLAVALDQPKPDSFFMAGLFSVVDALLDLPMSEAIELLPFAKPIREALVNLDGPIGQVLSCIIAYELGNWNEVHCGNLETAAIRQCYTDSISAVRKMPKTR